MSTQAGSPSIPLRLNVSDEFGYWLSGLFDGEGCFLFKNTVREVTGMVPKVKITLRADDRSVIEYIQSQLGCGRIYANQYRPEKNKTTKPWVEFRVQRISDLAEVIVPLFERYPLHSKKVQEFALWKIVVRHRYLNRGSPISMEERELYGKINAWISNSRGRG